MSKYQRVYVVANFHHLPSILGAYEEDRSPDKLLMCEANTFEYLSEIVDAGAKIRTFTMPKTGISLLRSLAEPLGRRQEEVSLVTTTLMGAHNLCASSLFKVVDVEYVDQLGEFRLERINPRNVKQWLGKFAIQVLLRRTVQLYRWDHVIAFGLPNGRFVPPIAPSKLVSVPHNFDAILLDVELSDFEIDLDPTLRNITQFVSRFKSVGVKRHPRLPLSLGSYLDIPEVSFTGPAELLATDSTVLLYLVSAAASAFTQRVNLFPLVVFKDPKSRLATRDFIERHNEALELGEIEYARLV